jgi:hypothetical protein
MVARLPRTISIRIVGARAVGIDSNTFVQEPHKCEQTVARRESNGLSF